MATKRLLYKPAQANVGKKRNRRPLAQGRLVTAQSQSATSGPRLQQGQVNESRVSVVSTFTDRDDPIATPRRAVPRATQHSSPLPNPPAPTLDLSDNEDYAGLAPTTHKVTGTPDKGVEVQVHRHSVMVFDASGLPDSPDRVDVDCIVGYEKSPARVIYHSPDSKTNLRGTAEDAVFQVPVNHVHRVHSTSPEPVISPLSTAASDAAGARGTEEEGDIMDTANNIDTNTSKVLKHSINSARKGDRLPKLPQPNFDESGDSEPADSGSRKAVKKKKKVGAPSATALEATSDSDACSLFEYVPQNKSRPPKPASAQKKPPGSERKKRGERVVPSRYMQSAMSKRAADVSSLSEKSIGAKKSLNLGSSVNKSGSLSKSNTKKTPSSQSAQRQASNISPSRSKGRVIQGKTSTPTHDEAPVMASCDASAINPELSMLSVIDASHMRIGGSGHNLGSQSPRRQMKKKVDSRLQQQLLDMAYARYLQWLFLDSKATKMLREQEKDAMRQIHSLWKMMEEKQAEKAQLQLDIARLRHLNTLDKQLEAQHNGLEPVMRAIPRLQKDYSHLVSALDTTRHQIHTRGIHIPEDEDCYLDALEQVLQESEQLLGSLNMMTKNEAPGVKNFADAIQAVETAVDAECLELYRCGEMLSAVQSLATHENSLRVQAMQANRLLSH